MSEDNLIWVTEPIHPDAVELLAASAEVIGPEQAEDQRLKEVAALIVRARTIDATLLDTMPNLAVIGKHGAGTDNIDMDEAQRRGIQVYRADGANAESVADLAVLLAMMLLRSPDLHDRALKAGNQKQNVPPPAYELSEHNIGILGMGAIGRAVSSRLIGGFAAQVAAFDPALSQQKWPVFIRRYDNVSSLIRNTNLLFLHLPLVPETRNLVGAEQLAMLMPGAFIVNCARGGIVDEKALAEALASGQLAGAASDVFDVEPPAPDSPLLLSPGRFVGTPHIGAATNAGLRRTGLIIVNRVLKALSSISSKGQLA